MKRAYETLDGKLFDCSIMLIIIIVFTGFAAKNAGLAMKDIREMIENGEIDDVEAFFEQIYNAGVSWFGVVLPIWSAFKQYCLNI